MDEDSDGHLASRDVEQRFDSLVFTRNWKMKGWVPFLFLELLIKSESVAVNFKQMLINFAMF
jgi:hypothetical protein